MKPLTKVLTPPRVIALGFALTILIGSGLLKLPVCERPGVSLRYIEALYTAASAVCVTGLIAVDAADTFTGLGQAVLGLLIQIGGLGVTTVGAGIILATGRRMDLRSRTIFREAVNLDSLKGIVVLVREIFFTTVIAEGVGALLCLPSFLRGHTVGHAIGISLFHAVAAFNNAGFDILGGGTNLIPYREDVLLNLVTCVLVFLGGIGFLVLREVRQKRLRWKPLSMHAKVVLSVSAVLTVGGTVLLKLTENLTWLGALFHSVSARTAGFSTYPLSGFTQPGLLVMLFLMLVGASPGSTGGGIKTTTLFVLLKGIGSAATNRSEKAFRYAIPRTAFRKAAVILLLALGVIFTGTYLLTVLEPSLSLRDALFEMTSAFATVGLSTGITAGLGVGAKLLSSVIMYIGRLGPLTVATLWYFSRGERVRYPEGDMAIG